MAFKKHQCHNKNPTGELEGKSRQQVHISFKISTKIEARNQQDREKYSKAKESMHNEF